MTIPVPVIAALVVGLAIALVAWVRRPVTQEQIDRMAARSPLADAWPLPVVVLVLLAMWAISTHHLVIPTSPPGTPPAATTRR